LVQVVSLSSHPGGAFPPSSALPGCALPAPGMAPPRMLAALIMGSALAPLRAEECGEVGCEPWDYRLVWKAQGTRFFDGFDFQTVDKNYGAAQYLDSEQAAKAGVAVAHETHAILRTGARVGSKRESVNIISKQGWQHFFMMVRFSHLPHGCGLWPALWLLGLGKEWPLGGELDILEWANDAPEQVSFHVGDGNRCTLDSESVHAHGEMPDLNNMSYDCVTDYRRGKLGCAPNRYTDISGEQMSGMGGVLAVESTAEHLKIFHIPEAELPSDIDTAQPRPWLWDKWVISYLPFALSNSKHPGSCPHSWDIISQQHLILNINMCGEWGGPTWKLAKSCVNKVGPQFPSQCKIADPVDHPEDLGKDCCTMFVLDENETYGTDDYLQETAFFNISYVKVFQDWFPVNESTVVV